MKANKKSIEKGASDFNLLRQVARLEQTCHEYAVECNRLGQFEGFVRSNGFLPKGIVALYARTKDLPNDKTEETVSEALDKFNEALLDWGTEWALAATKPQEAPAAEPAHEPIAAEVASAIADPLVG